MEIHINETDRIVEFWLTNAERSDASLRNSLQEEYRSWKARKYLPVVFLSGGGNLETDLSKLLKVNLPLASGQGPAQTSS